MTQPDPMDDCDMPDPEARASVAANAKRGAYDLTDQPRTAAGRTLLEQLGRFESTVVPSTAIPFILAIEAEARRKHSDPDMDERCDGHCARDECVCPEGGWEAESERRADRIEALEAIRVAADVLRPFLNCIGDTTEARLVRQLDAALRAAIEDTDD